MENLIAIGALITLIGLGALGYCILCGVRARRAGLQGDALIAVLRRLVPINLAALCLSAMGLSLVTIGILL